MKKNIFLAVILLLTISSCTNKTQPDFLYLNAKQLKALGIELNNKGVFYKNENPTWSETREKYACLAFYCTNDNYLITKRFDVTDTLKRKNSADSLLVRMKMTRNDFYPMLIGGIKYRFAVNNENAAEDLKLLPVAICMTETNLPKRKDTLILWLRPTESLNKLLPKGIHMVDYVRSSQNTPSTSVSSFKHASNIFPVILFVLLLNYYRDYISDLKRKRVSIELSKKKRRRTAFLLFLIIWGVTSTLRFINTTSPFSDIRWYKALLIGFLAAIIAVLIIVVSAEYFIMRKQNNREIM